MDARKANDRIAEKAEQLRFVSRVPMLCECSAPDCRTVVMVALHEYREIRRTEDAVLTAPGHDAEGAVLESQTSTYDVRRLSRRRDGTNGGRRSA
ncbi:MAG TPA: hypothetical protein VJ716_07575 [Gaiellaceae bacterium]|nr:hypothetical protein [Gaiellaceae bacterium]